MASKIKRDNKFIKTLIQNAQLGNNSAFEQLYEINIEKVFAVAIRLVADVELAREVTVKVFVNAWENIKNMRNDITFESWLSSITVYTSLNELRELEKNKKNRSADAVNYRFKDALDKEIAKLEDNLRIIFVLHEIENYTVEEAADLMSISTQAAKENLIKARRILIKDVDV